MVRVGVLREWCRGYAGKVAGLMKGLTKNVGWRKK